MDAKTVVPRPVQKTIFMGLPNERNAPFVKSPRCELDALISSSFPRRASLIASQASLSMRRIPIRLRIIFAILFWTINARPVSAMIAHVVSPTREPNWTNSAGINPRAAPRRTVSAVITPGGAQKAMARTNDDKNNDMDLLQTDRGMPRSVFPPSISSLRTVIRAARNEITFSNQNTAHIHVEWDAGGQHPLHGRACT